ncbi:MAG TPA: enoyl-CoA hydratase/isomerase family protein [Candidatus Cloacimonetes bacterium]|nr:enoyl-CoA hydratase/isomerase family protein [Candidatus Cloacimonadota bacterium]
MNKNFKTIQLKKKDKIAYITLNRPEIHNAFNDTMISELTEVFEDLKDNDDVRVIILTGNGKSFCAGADLKWMKKMKDFSYEENLEDSLALSKMFFKMYSIKKPTICLVNGAAIGGGTGLVAVCDIAIAAEKAKFSFSEVKLGLVPACISPYVVKKCGEGRCREFFLTGERLSADKACKSGLINFVVPLEEMDVFTGKITKQLITSGPEAIGMCKDLLSKVPEMDLIEAGDFTADVISKMRISDEGQEGMNAFFEKRKPDWIE